MFNNLKNLQKIRFSELKDRFNKASIDKKKDIIRICLISLGLLIFTLLGIIFSFKLNQPKIYIPPQDTIEINDNPKIPDGIGDTFDFLNPFSSFQASITEAISQITKDAISLFDDYVAYTPNIAESTIQNIRGENLGVSLDRFYTVTITIAWLILPLLIAINGSFIVLEGSFRGRQIAIELSKKVLLFVIGIIAMRFILSLGIQFTNALNNYVLSNLVSNSTQGILSETLVKAFGMSLDGNTLNFSLLNGLNTFAQIILWIGIFFFMLTLLFQFIIRFFHLILHFILYPIVFAIGLLPGGGQFFKTYIEEIVRSLIVQPVFLIGLGIVIEIINSATGPLTKIILGLGSLAFLNLIPAIINRFSGILWGVAGAVGAGIVGAATIGSLSKVKEGFTRKVTGGEKSFRSASGRILGDALLGTVPGLSKGRNSYSQKYPQKSNLQVIPNTSRTGSFRQAVDSKGGRLAFASLGMKPIQKLIQEGTTNLYRSVPDFSRIKEVSLQDKKVLSDMFNKSNLTSSPLVTGRQSFQDMVDLSGFNPASPKTTNALSEIINPKSEKFNLSNVFSANDPAHWNHLTEWYAKNQIKVNGKSMDHHLKFANDPVNKTEVLRKASNEGYFKAQGVKFVKTTDQVNKKPITKYYEVTNNE